MKSGQTIRGSPLTCKDCQHWKRESRIWGKCEVAATGTFKHSKGYICNHTYARSIYNKVCKTRFIQKEGELNVQGGDSLH